MLHDDNPQEESQPGGRVAFMHEAGKRFYELAGRYNQNEPVPVQNYLNCQRQLRARMMSLKNENGKGSPMGSTPTPNRSRHLRLLAAEAAKTPSTTGDESCQTCRALADVGFVLGRRRRPDGCFGSPFVIEVKRCPTCGRVVKA